MRDGLRRLTRHQARGTRILLEVLGRIDGGSAHTNFKMQVRPCRTAGTSDLGDLLTDDDDVPDLDVHT